MAYSIQRECSVAAKFAGDRKAVLRPRMSQQIHELPRKEILPMVQRPGNQVDL